MTVSQIKPQTFGEFVSKYGLFYISNTATALVLLLSVCAFMAGIFFGWVAFVFSLLVIPIVLLAQLRSRFSSWPDTPIDTSKEISFQSVFLSRQLLLNADAISEVSENSLQWSLPWQDIARFSFFAGDKYSPTHYYFASTLTSDEIRLTALGYAPDPQFVAEVIRLFWQANKARS